MANNGLKQLLKLKNRELKNIRKLAQTILDQRSEVEQYFLEALEQVKTEIRQKREDEYKLAMAEYNAQMRRATTSKGDIKFPSIKAPQHMLAKAGSDIRSTSDPRAGMLSKPVGMNEKVDLRDLGWEDRERVLRLLFAKINNVQGQMLSGESDGANRGGADSRNFSVGDSEQMWGSNVVPQTATSVDEEGFGYNKTGLV